MEHVVNFSLLARPTNWIIILVILFLVALIANVLYTAATTGQSPIPLPDFLNAN